MAKTLSIRDWYLATYPEDGLGFEINPKANFLTLKQALENGDDVYEHLGVGDSVIRERVFEKASRVYGTSYDYVYDLWMHGGRTRRAAAVAGILGLAE